MGTEKRERQKANRQLKYQQQEKDASRQRLTKRIVLGIVVAIALLLFLLVVAWFVNRGDDDDTPTTTTTTTAAAAQGFAYGAGECPPAAGVTEPVKEFTQAPQECIDPAASYTATIVTDRGDIVIDLDTDATPGTVNNFVTLARYGYYDDTTIFRSAKGIDIIQGGGNATTDSFGYTIPDEGSAWTYPPGVIAMANTGSPNSGGAQWFVTTGPDSANLDALGTYTVFGTVTEGLDVAQAIQELAVSETDDSMSETVTVERVTIAQS